MNLPNKQKIGHPLLQELSQETQEKAKLFCLLESLILENSNVSFETYLKSAFSILDGVEKSFIQDRKESFLLWFIKQIASLQNSANTQSQIYALKHTVCYPFQSKEVLGMFLHFCRVDCNALPNIITFQNALTQAFPDIHLVEGSSFTSMQHKKSQLSLYFEVQKTESPFTNKELGFLKTFLFQMMQEEHPPSPSSIIVPGNRELLLKNFRGALNTLQEKDIPQVLIDFNRQVKETLHFSILVCQVKNKTPHP